MGPSNTGALGVAEAAPRNCQLASPRARPRRQRGQRTLLSPRAYNPHPRCRFEGRFEFALDVG
eukprot:11195819-Lingulodinium_polyedra.AAC.1